MWWLMDRNVVVAQGWNVEAQGWNVVAQGWNVVAHRRGCGGSLTDMFWLIGGKCGGSLTEMSWLIGGDVVAH